ncbi:ATP-binding response regulator [Hyalangium versicolor]|uniref:ATP-binding response regulator n=1 Tax=Hyalangium versicolor TaxID=2861190 RepID=UPI001CCFD6B2|nr:hybrid sensor histidine kinase/response regulator [Hyalangium versicolor]
MKVVLVVEDEEALLEVFSSVITDMGHTVLGAHAGDEALGLARAHLPDLIVSDHMMPGLTGVELMRAVQGDERLSGTPFILVSAVQPQGAHEAHAYMAKPVSLETFERVVEEGLHASVGRRGERLEGEPLTQAPENGLNLARAEMLSWVAHEIKTPLSSARLNLEMMLRDLGSDAPEAQRRRGTQALHQLDRMSTLVNSVLEASQLSDGRVQLQRERCDLKAFLQGVVRYWRDTRPDFEFNLALPAEEATAWMDPERVRQILNNLVSNAVKYGGTSAPVVLMLELSPGRAIVAVTDRGQGMDASELPRIFDRFHRAEGSMGQGHGLGLYIASALARLHGGTLQVRSQRGEGTTFTLSLPLAH